jgi:16S rRNA (guanine527-N7)-methyltransferase
MMINKIELITALEQNNIVVSDAMTQSLLHYLQLMLKWNNTYNLTAITDPHEMIYLHLVDSLVIAPYVTGKQCLDLGTGAGLPGIPLAIIHPEQQWTLVDKNSKKTRFLIQAVAELGLKNVQVVHFRGEEFHPAHGFDNILSRAFGSLRLFVDTTRHLLNPDGELIAMKGKYPDDELADLPTEVSVQSVQHIDIKGIDIERHLVCLRLTQ